VSRSSTGLDGAADEAAGAGGSLAQGFSYTASRMSLANLAQAMSRANLAGAEGGEPRGPPPPRDPAPSGTPQLRAGSSFRFSGRPSATGTAGGGAASTGAASEAAEAAERAKVHFLCISPDAPTNPVLYYLGPYVGGRFLLEEASGPHRLDLGDTLYAPNTFVDARGRQVLWGWLQERREGGDFGYAGCLSVPRVLTVFDGRLHQEPLPEIKRLRRGQGWYSSWVDVAPDAPVPLERVRGRALDIECTIDRGQASAAGLLFNSWSDAHGSAVLVYDWDRGILEVIYESAARDGGGQVAKRVGGPIDVGEDDPVKLRVLLDHSCLEVYEGTGHVLSTRVYRGQAREEPGSSPGVEFVAYGGTAHLVRVEAWEMGPIWEN